MFPQLSPLILALSLLHVSHASNPQVDFDRMGKVGLAGAFAGLDFFNGTTVSFDPTTSTLLSRDEDGALTRLASTNSGGSILAGCALNNVFYLAGDFTSIEGVSASNVASYTPSTGAFSTVGSGGPNGQVNALFCDAKQNKIWAGGRFSSPGAAIAIYDPKSSSWSSAPFAGISGAQAEVRSITTNSSEASVFFSGSFITSFGNANAILNGTNNPNVPFSPGASPFSSSLVPIPLENAQVNGSPSSSQSGFSDIHNVLCPAGADGSGNSWFAQDNSTPLVTVQTFSFISANGVRLGNTFQPNHGTTAFSVTTIPDNKVQTLKYLDPTTGQNSTCTDACPLSTDSSILYQDFLFESSLSITGVQVKLSEFSGSGAGLHILQLLSSGAFASSIDQENGQSCFSPNPSNTTKNGDWISKVANTDIPGTVQTVLVSDVKVGTPASEGPTFTWIPYVSASGNYDINLLVPGCTNFQDCDSRTSVKVKVFPGDNLDPFITTVSQQNKDDATVLLYSGPILPSSPDFVTTITLSLADSPIGQGQNGKYEIVADRVQLVLKSANVTASSNSTVASSTSSLARGFGFLEWPRSSTAVDSSVNGKTAFPNTTLTSLDALGFSILSSMGGTASLTSAGISLNAVAHHSSGIFIGGAFNLTSGSASGNSNIVAFKNGQLSNVAEGGLNGEVSSLALYGDQLFVGGSFTDTQSSSTQGKLSGIALYDIVKNSWTSLAAGVNGPVASIGLADNQIQVVGNFTQIIATSTTTGMNAAGLAIWDLKSGSWVNSGGFIVGTMAFIGNGTSSSQFLAGNVAASQKFGASGLVMLKNNGENGPSVSPLSVGLGGTVSGSSSTTTLRRRAQRPSASAWMSHIKFSHIFARQTNSQQASLAPPLPATAPAVLAGAFWANKTSSKELTILGGNFSFVATGSSNPAEAVAIYDPESNAIQALAGPQINGTVRALFVDGDSLYIGGQFTIPGATVNGLALYDLSKNEWNLNGLQSLQPASGKTVVVRSISTSSSKPSMLIVAGSFSQAGSLSCPAICSFDTSAKQWNNLGSGVEGDVASVAYAGDDQSLLIIGGSITLSDNTAANVARYSLENSTWTSVGNNADIPGPISALEVNSRNASSIFAAGQSIDGSSSFLSFWDGNKWSTLGSNFEQGTTVAQMTMVPLQSSHQGNAIIQSDRMLMISGLLSTSAGNASSALYDGQNLIPYVVSSSASGSAGSVSSLFHSFTSFSFSQRRFLATGVVILISIAIAAGVVFLLALLGILWTLFSRKDDKLNKFDPADDEDDDSTRLRPSSLLEHINAATRTTITGASPYSNYNSEKEEQATSSPNADQDPFGPDASNYMRAETPSDAVGGLLAEETSRPAHARYSFDGTGEGELPISSGAEVEVLDDRDPAWWYARDVRTGQEGVVPAAYLY